MIPGRFSFLWQHSWRRFLIAAFRRYYIIILPIIHPSVLRSSSRTSPQSRSQLVFYFTELYIDIRILYKCRQVMRIILAPRFKMMHFCFRLRGHFYGDSLISWIWTVMTTLCYISAITVAGSRLLVGWPLPHLVPSFSPFPCSTSAGRSF